MKAIQAELPEFTREDIVDSIISYQRSQAKPKLHTLQSDLARFKREVKYDKSLRAQISDIENKIRNKDYAQPSRAARTYDDRIESLRFQRDRLKRELNNQIESMRPKSIRERFVYGPFNEFRAIMTSFDLSAAARQGGFIGFGNPALAVKSFGPMLKAFRSEEMAHKIDNEIRARPNARLYQRSKLFLPDPDGIGNVGSKEEVFATNFPIINAISKRLPVAGPALAGGVHGSARAYITFLNKLRADQFDVMASAFAKNGGPTQEEAQAIAKFINVATGRGGLGPLENAAKGLNTLFFAPRYVTSRFQTLLEPGKLAAGKHMYGGNRATDKLIAKEYAKYAVGIGSTLALLSTLPGVTIEKDPRSTDFLKVKIGNTRLDLLSGLQQAAVFMAQEAPYSGGKKSLKTGELTDLSGGTFGQDRFKNAVDFARKKLSPAAGTAVDLATHKNVIGQPVTPASAARNLVTPLLISDVAKSLQEDYGVPTKIALGLSAMLGAGLNTFDATEIRAPERQVKTTPTMLEDYPDLPATIEFTTPEFERLMKAHEAGAAAVEEAKKDPEYAPMSEAEKRKFEQEAYDDVFKDTKEEVLDAAVSRLTGK